MEILQHLGDGFSPAYSSPSTPLLLCSSVSSLGLLVAVLPGLTLVMGVVLALPFTYGMAITPAIILLTAMYVSRHLRRRHHVDPVPHSRRADGRAAAVGRLRDGARRRAGTGARLDAVRGALTGGLVVTATVMVALAHAVRDIALTSRLARIFRDRPVRAHERRDARRRLARQCVHQPVSSAC